MNQAEAKRIAAFLSLRGLPAAATSVTAMQAQIEAIQHLVAEWRDGGSVHEFAAKVAAIVGEVK